MQELTARVTSSLLPFPAVTLEALVEDEISLCSELHGHFTVGRSGLAWLSRGPHLEVVHAMTAERLSAYRFSTGGNHPPIVLAARDFSWLKRSGLLVGLEEVEGSVLCLYDLGLSRVVKAVVIPGRITAIEPLVSYGGASASTQHLHQSLRWFFGIAAVVTDLGHVLLVDLCLDDLSCSQSELKAADLQVVIKTPAEIPKLREVSRRLGRHLCLQLNAPGGVSVTALQYISRTNQLCVGFSDGHLQLWNVKTLKKEFHSMLDGGCVPVHAFTFQEPENDPRNCCYLWVVQSSQDLKGDVVSLHLLQLAFSERKCLSSGKILYEGLEYCEERYSQDLGGRSSPRGTQTTDTRLLGCQTIEKFRPHPDRDDSMSDVSSPDTSVSVFVWQVKAYGQGTPSTHIGLFDINRWYHAQMPDSLRTGQSLQNCPYFAVWNLDPVLQMVSPQEVLDVLVHDRSLSRALPLTCPPPEQYFNPTSYNFDATCLLYTGLVHLTCSGHQKETLSFLKKATPCTSDNISNIYSRCLVSGLLSTRLTESHNSSLSQEEQLDAILSTAVETSSLRLITGCIKQWTAEEEPGSALNLRYILDWAWNKVVQTKDELDNICSPLFNCSSNFIDPLTLQLLQHSQRLLGNLSSIFHCLLTEAQELTQNGLHGLMNKNMVSSLISQYAQVVLWFCRVGLLPEGSDDDGLQLPRPVYSHATIKANYTAYREELSWLAKGGGCVDCLMIDGLVSQCGQRLTDLWTRDEGGTGQYPPPSLHALLDVYLLDDIKEDVKHAIVIYLLLDVMYSSPNKEEASVESFPPAFAIPTGLVKLVQGFWLLDHHDHQAALEVLLHPAVAQSQFEWQHERVLQVLMCQGHHLMALRYLQSAKPSITTSPQAKLCLSVLLHNNCLIEAWSLLRQHQNHLDTAELLGFFFESCQELGFIKDLLKLPLDMTEQEYLEKFLKTTRGLPNRELLMVHYLQQANYIPALQLNQTLKTHLLAERDPKLKERAVTRDSIMHLYGKVLPRAQLKLAMERTKPYQNPHSSHKEVTRPQPLSTVTKRSSSQSVTSRAGFINNVLTKIEELWLGRTSSTQASPVRSPEPFLGTPIPVSSKRKSRFLGLVFHPSCQSPPPSQVPRSPLVSWTSSKSVSKAPEFRLLQTPQVVKRARALVAAGPGFTGFTPQSILRSSLRPTPVASPSASPGRSVTPPLRRKDNRITFIEQTSTPESDKVPAWTNGQEAAESEIHMLTRGSLKALRKTWSAVEAEETPPANCVPPPGGAPLARPSVHEAAEEAQHTLVPARISLSLDNSYMSARSDDTTLEFYDVAPPAVQDDEGQRSPEEEEEEDGDDVVVVAFKEKDQVTPPAEELPLLAAEEEMKDEELEIFVERELDLDDEPENQQEDESSAEEESPSVQERDAVAEDVPEEVGGATGVPQAPEEELQQTLDLSDFVERHLFGGDVSPPLTFSRSYDAAADEGEEDSGSDVEVIKEVQGYGGAQTFQSGPMFGPQDQEIFIPSVSEDEEFSLVPQGAEIKVVGEEMGGEVVMVRLDADEEEPESSYMDMNPPTTLLVPLELVDEEADFDRLPDLQPAEDHHSSFSLVLDMDEGGVTEKENHRLQLVERTGTELQIQPLELSQMEVDAPLEGQMLLTTDPEPDDGPTEVKGVTFTVDTNTWVVEPEEVEPSHDVVVEPSAEEVEPTPDVVVEPSAEEVEPTPDVVVEPSAEEVEPTLDVVVEPSAEDVEPTPDVVVEPSAEEVEPTPDVVVEPSAEEVEPTPDVVVEPSAEEVEPSHDVVVEPSAEEVESSHDVVVEPSAEEVEPTPDVVVKPSAEEVEPSHDVVVEPSAEEVESSHDVVVEPSAEEVEPTPDVEDFSPKQVALSPEEMESLSTVVVEPSPLAEEEPSPLAEEEPSPLAEEEPSPLAEEEPSPLAEEEPSPLAEVEPSPLAEVEPSPLAEEEPSPLAEVEPSPLADVEPSPLADVEPSPLAEVEPSPLADVEPSPLADVEPSRLSPVQDNKRLQDLTRTRRKTEEASEGSHDGQQVPDTPTSLRKKKTPLTPTRRTTRAKSVTFVSPVPEEAEGPDEKVREAPPSPARTPRKTRKTTDAKVVSPSRRSTRIAGAATHRAEDQEATESDSAVSVASTASSTRTRTSRTTHSGTDEESASSWDVPQPEASKPATPRRSSRKVLESSDRAGVQRSTRKTRTRVWEPALLEEDEESEPEPTHSPGRRSQQTSRNTLTIQPQSARKTRASSSEKTGAGVDQSEPPDSSTRRPTRTKLWEQSKEDLLLLEPPLDVDSDTVVADALVKRIQDEEKQEGGAVFRRAVRTRSSKSTSEDVKEIQIPEPEEDQSSPDETSYIFSPSRKRTRASRSKSPGTASARVTRPRGRTAKEVALQDEDDLDQEVLPERRTSSRRTGRSTVVPHPSSVVEAVLVSPPQTPAAPRVQKRAKEAESPARGVSLRRKRTVETLLPRPVTRRKKL